AAGDSRGRRDGKNAVQVRLLLDAEAGELLVELGDLAAAVDDPVLAGPRRVRLRIDVEPQRVALLAVAGPRLELGPVGHDDVDLVILRMDARLHDAAPAGATDPDRPRERRHI